MKISNILLTCAVAANLFSTVVFAEPTKSTPTSPANIEQKNTDAPRKNDFTHKHKHMKDDMGKDPVSVLENKKKNITELYKEGKISKEDADKITRKIDERIKAVKEFNKLTVEQKREVLISKYKLMMALRVKEGKITQEKADEKIANFSKEIQNWDGNGFPEFMHKKHMKK